MAADVSGAGRAIHPDVARQGDEIVITKHRVNAFWVQIWK